MPCTPETARCVVATLYTHDLPDCCRGHLTHVMFQLDDALRAAGVRHFMDYGTLLGAVRNPFLGLEPGIVPHDKDGDLGFLAEDWEKLLSIPDSWSEEREVTPGHLERHGTGLGLHWIHKLPRQEIRRAGTFTYGAGDSIKVCRSAVNHTNVDLFPWYDRAYLMRPDGKRYRYHYVHVDRFKGKEFPEARLLPLTEIEWEGRQLYAPGDWEWFVEHRYGAGWRKPVHANNDGVKR
jgi:hypothetical protein